MASTGAGNGGLQTGISLTGLGTLNAGSSVVVSGAFTIPYVTNATAALCDRAHLQFTAASFTPTANPAYIQGAFLTEDDGSNYDPTWISNSQLFPTDDTFFTIPLPTAATTFVKRKGIWLPSCVAAGANVQLALLNLTGVAITVSAMTLYPYGGMNG